MGFLAELFRLLRVIIERIFRVKSPEERRLDAIEAQVKKHKKLREELDVAFAKRDGHRIADIRNRLFAIAHRINRLRSKKEDRAAGK